MASINELLNLAQYISQGEQSQRYGIPEMIQGGIAGYQGEIERKKREHAERLKLAEQVIGLKQKMLEIQEAAKSQRILDVRTGAMSMLKTAGVKEEQMPNTEMGKVTNLVDKEFEEHIGVVGLTDKAEKLGFPEDKSLKYKYKVTPSGREITAETPTEPETVTISEPWEVDAFQKRGYTGIEKGSNVGSKLYEKIMGTQIKPKVEVLDIPHTKMHRGTGKETQIGIFKGKVGTRPLITQYGSTTGEGDDLDQELSDLTKAFNASKSNAQESRKKYENTGEEQYNDSYLQYTAEMENIAEDMKNTINQKYGKNLTTYEVIEQAKNPNWWQKFWGVKPTEKVAQPVGKTKQPPKLSPEDQEALNWANKNTKDKRAKKIKDNLNQKYNYVF